MTPQLKRAQVAYSKFLAMQEGNAAEAKRLEAELAVLSEEIARLDKEVTLAEKLKKETAS